MVAAKTVWSVARECHRQMLEAIGAQVVQGHRAPSRTGRQCTEVGRWKNVHMLRHVSARSKVTLTFNMR